MDITALKSILTKQHEFFSTGATLNYEFRKQHLLTLKSLIKNHVTDIALVLKKDLGKPIEEGIFHEVLLVEKEIDYILRHLKSWMKPQKIHTPFPFLWPARSEIRKEPYGITFIIGPWNYPFLLLFSPLMGAIAAGNCAILKPSEHATHTESLVCELIEKYFPQHYIATIKATANDMELILKEKFDYLFFTGGTAIGKKIMQAASQHLTPVTLELGGKSPCIVDDSANIPFAAHRIAWGKTCNAGQTCIAPDYIYVARNKKDELIKELQKTFQRFFGNDCKQSLNYGRIIDKRHFDRLINLLTNAKIIAGGEYDASTLYISPTLIEVTDFNAPIMQEEIFGPLLPILIFDDIETVIHTLKQKEKPLALYLFSNNNTQQQRILNELSFGSACINDCLLQIANYYLPFGGVGMSGMGAYHGKYSFDTFSHTKSVYYKKFSFEAKIEYPPYSKTKLKWLRRLMRV